MTAVDEDQHKHGSERKAGGSLFADGRARLEQAQKPGGGVPAYTRWVNRRAARLLAASAYALGISPNGVTAISAVVSLSGIVVLVLAPVGVLTGAIVAFLLALGYVLDSADGQVARLSGKGSPAGEWLDHVVDAIRTPLIHVAVLVALFRDGHAGLTPVQIVALAFVVLTAGQFMSQILAEQLGRAAGAESAVPSANGGVKQSILLLPTDMGVTCWIFVCWGVQPVFGYVYAALFLINLVHTGASMYRKYRKLAALSRA